MTTVRTSFMAIVLDGKDGFGGGAIVDTRYYLGARVLVDWLAPPFPSILVANETAWHDFLRYCSNPIFPLNPIDSRANIDLSRRARMTIPTSVPGDGDPVVMAVCRVVRGAESNVTSFFDHSTVGGTLQVGTRSKRMEEIGESYVRGARMVGSSPDVFAMFSLCYGSGHAEVFESVLRKGGLACAWYAASKGVQFSLYEEKLCDLFDGRDLIGPISKGVSFPLLTWDLYYFYRGVLAAKLGAAQRKHSATLWAALQHAVDFAKADVAARLPEIPGAIEKARRAKLKGSAELTPELVKDWVLQLIPEFGGSDKVLRKRLDELFSLSADSLGLLAAITKDRRDVGPCDVYAIIELELRYGCAGKGDVSKGAGFRDGRPLLVGVDESEAEVEAGQYVDRGVGESEESGEGIARLAAKFEAIFAALQGELKLKEERMVWLTLGLTGRISERARGLLRLFEDKLGVDQLVGQYEKVLAGYLSAAIKKRGFEVVSASVKRLLESV